jgi:O-methyltransferase domain
MRRLCGSRSGRLCCQRRSLLAAAFWKQVPALSHKCSIIPQRYQRAVSKCREACSRLRVACAGSIPAAKNSKDVYMMRTILHDWSDERTTDILRNTRAAIGTAGSIFCKEVPPPAVLRLIRCLQHVSASKATSASSGAGACTGTRNATLALLELAPADGLQERFEGFVYMDVQMLTVCDGMERSAVRGYGAKLWPLHC